MKGIPDFVIPDGGLHLDTLIQKVMSVEDVEWLPFTKC